MIYQIAKHLYAFAHHYEHLPYASTTNESLYTAGDRPVACRQQEGRPVLFTDGSRLKKWGTYAYVPLPPKDWIEMPAAEEMVFPFITRADAIVASGPPVLHDHRCATFSLFVDPTFIFQPGGNPHAARFPCEVAEDWLEIFRDDFERFYKARTPTDAIGFLIQMGRIVPCLHRSQQLSVRDLRRLDYLCPLTRAEPVGPIQADWIYDKLFDHPYSSGCLVDCGLSEMKLEAYKEYGEKTAYVTVHSAKVVEPDRAARFFDAEWLSHVPSGVRIEYHPLGSNITGFPVSPDDLNKFSILHTLKVEVKSWNGFVLWLPSKHLCESQLKPEHSSITLSWKNRRILLAKDKSETVGYTSLSDLEQRFSSLGLADKETLHSVIKNNRVGAHLRIVGAARACKGMYFQDEEVAEVERLVKATARDTSKLREAKEKQAFCRFQKLKASKLLVTLSELEELVQDQILGADPALASAICEMCTVYREPITHKEYLELPASDPSQTKIERVIAILHNPRTAIQILESQAPEVLPLLERLAPEELAAYLAIRSL